MQTYLQQDSSVETENLLIHRDKLADRLIYTQRVKEGHGYVGMWINRKKKRQTMVVSKTAETGKIIIDNKEATSTFPVLLFHSSHHYISIMTCC